MPVLYKLHQEKNEKSKNYNKWYARAVMNGTVDLDTLAEIMQRNCTVKKSDIRAVLAELVETMRDQLQNSMRVKIDGLGSFKIGLRTKCAESATDFNVNQNIVGMRVNFVPEYNIDRKAKSAVYPLLTGAVIRETAKNDVDKTESAESGD